VHIALELDWHPFIYTRGFAYRVSCLVAFEMHKTVLTPSNNIRIAIPKDRRSNFACDRHYFGFRSPSWPLDRRKYDAHPRVNAVPFPPTTISDACATPRAKFQPRESSRVSPLPTEFACLTLIHHRRGGDRRVRSGFTFYRTLRNFLGDTARATGMWVIEYAEDHSVRYADQQWTAKMIR